MKNGLHYIEWIDSSRGGGWVTLDRFEEEKRKRPANFLKCISVGYIMHEDKKSVTIASHFAYEPEQFCGDITIPKVAITKRKKIKGFEV